MQACLRLAPTILKSAYLLASSSSGILGFVSVVVALHVSAKVFEEEEEEQDRASPSRSELLLCQKYLQAILLG